MRPERYRRGPPPERKSVFGSMPEVGREDDVFLPSFRASELEGRAIPPREWLVEHLVPMHTVTLLGGDGGTGKSLLALQLAVAVATGQPWLWRDVRAGGAFYLCAEDERAELERRLARIAEGEGRRLSDMKALEVVSLADRDALLAHMDGSGALEPTPLYAALDRRLGAERRKLLVLDTQADLFPGNENDRAQARQFVALLRRLAIRHECAVVMLSHPSLTGMSSGTGASGSTAWNNSVRSRLYLERIVDEGFEPDADARRLVTKKSNYARTGLEIAMRYDAGVFRAEQSETAMDRKARGAKAERVFLKLLRAFEEQGRHVSPTPSVTYAPTVFAKHPEAEGITKRAFQTAMDVLLGTGKIEVQTHGRAGKERRHLAIVEGAT